jgi:hypothetical protein
VANEKKIMIEKDKIKKNALPIGIIILSIIAIYNVLNAYLQFNVLNYFSIIVSIIGIIGGFLYLKHGKPISYLTELWIILQIPYIDKIIFKTPTKAQYNDAIYDASQGIKSSLYLHLSWDDCMVLIGFNYLPLILIGILMYFKIPYLKTHHWLEDTQQNK